MDTVDLIPAPADDAVTFRLHTRRLWLGMALHLGLALILVRGLVLLLMLAAGVSPDAFDLVSAAAVVVVSALGSATLIAYMARRNLGWVRASAAGLEFAATRHRPAFLPWAAIQSVRLRYAGGLAELVVTPTHPDDFTVAQVPSREPRPRRRLGKPDFVVDVGMMTPGPAVLLAELDRRLAGRG